MFRPLQLTGHPTAIPWGALAPVLYVLSVGPVAWLLDKIVADFGTFISIMFALYFPLDWLADHVTVVQDVLSWYVNLWS